MKKNEASSTAILIAGSIVFSSGDERFEDLLPDEMIALSKAFLKGVIPPWQVTWLEILGRNRLARWVVRCMERLSVPGMIGHYILRKHRLESIVRESLADSDSLEQLVVLGAGFDTLATRIARKHPDLKVFELDHPATSSAKQAAFQLGYATKPANLAFMPIDLGTMKLNCSIGVDLGVTPKHAWNSFRSSRAGTTRGGVIPIWTISRPWRMKRGITRWKRSSVQLSTKTGQLVSVTNGCILALGHLS